MSTPFWGGVGAADHNPCDVGGDFRDNSEEFEHCWLITPRSWKAGKVISLLEIAGGRRILALSMYTQRTKTRAKTLSVSQISGVSREETVASISASPLAVHFNWLHAQMPTPPSSIKPCKRDARGSAAPSCKIQRSLDISGKAEVASLKLCCRRYCRYLSPVLGSKCGYIYATSLNQR